MFPSHFFFFFLLCVSVRWDNWAATHTDAFAYDYNLLVYSVCVSILCIAVTAFIHLETVFGTFMDFYDAKSACTRLALFVYCAVDAAMRLLLFGVCSTSLRADAWAMFVAAMCVRSAIFVRFQDDNAEGRAENAVVGFFLGLPCALCDLLMVEDHGTKPLIWTQYASFAETFAFGAAACMGAKHPLPPQFRCACQATVVDVAIFGSECRSRSFDEGNPAVSLYAAPLPPEGGGALLVTLAALWAVKFASFRLFGGYGGRHSVVKDGVPQVFEI